MSFSRQRFLPAIFNPLSRFPFSEGGEDELTFLQNWPSLFQTESNFSGISIKSDSKSVYVHLDMPGLKSDQINISFDNGTLFVKGEQKEEKKEKKGDEKIYRQSSRTYSYRIALPEHVDANKEPKASYNNGVLEITFAKSTPSQTKQIRVQKG